MLGWCSQLQWRAAEVCLAGLGSPSQLAAQDTKPALGKAVMPHTWPPPFGCAVLRPKLLFSLTRMEVFMQFALYCTQEGTKKLIDL